MINKPGPAALVAVVLILILSMACVLLAEAALPFTVGAQTGRATVAATAIPTRTPLVLPQITAMPYPPPGAAYPAPVQAATISAERISATEARICASAGPLYERAGYLPSYLFLQDWPGGCDVVQTRDRFGGYVYCLQASPSPPEFVCSEPLAAWNRTTMYFPLVAR